MTETENLKIITLEEIKQNDGGSGKRLWVLIDGLVYDLTDFKHPGGREALTDEHGEDRADEFDSIHSKAAKEQRKEFLIGKLKEDENSIKNKKSKSGNDENNTLITIIALVVLVVGVYIAFSMNLIG